LPSLRSVEILVPSGINIEEVEEFSLRECINLEDRYDVYFAGSTGAFYCACLALLNPGGDKVILFEPYYGCHVNALLDVVVDTGIGMCLEREEHLDENLFGSLCLQQTI